MDNFRQSLQSHFLVINRIWTLIDNTWTKNGILKQISLSFYKMETISSNQKLYFVRPSRNSVTKVFLKLHRTVKSEQRYLELSQGTVFLMTLSLNILNFEWYLFKSYESFCPSVTKKHYFHNTIARVTRCNAMKSLQEDSNVYFRAYYCVLEAIYSWQCSKLIVLLDWQFFLIDRIWLVADKRFSHGKWKFCATIY